MRNFLIIAIIALSVIATGSARAAEEGLGQTPFGTPSPSATTPTGQCNFTEYKLALTETESGGIDDISVCRDIQNRDTNASGRYQFMETTWNGYITRPNVIRECDAVPGSAPGRTASCTHANLGAAGCCVIQECVMNIYTAENLAMAQANSNCQALIGKTVQSSMGSKGACSQPVSWSGILAAYHLGGPDACDNVANGTGTNPGRGPDGFGEGDDDSRTGDGTSEKYYMCYHSGHPVPTDCDIPPADPSGTPPPTLTYPQYESLIGQGDEGYINLNGGIKETWVSSLMLMAEQFTANMAYQLKAIGMFFDAKEQLEVQRDLQERVAEAHRDYHPSEQMCTFGTFSTNLASTQRRADLTRDALSKEGVQRDLGSGDGKGVTNSADSLSRIKLFRDKFCNPSDNGGGLELLCPNETDPEMQNKDIDYTSAIDMPLTLDVNLTDDETTPDEETIFALIDNLFMHDPLPRVPTNYMDLQKYQYHYQNLRSIVAMRGVARNSIANIIALKSESPEQASQSGPYLKALMKEMGLPDEEVEKILGANPSYYAQMEFLTKTIYQNPTFYSNLYDKPANVKRIRAAMSAIKLMNDRDIHMAMIRREMLLSMMLELRLRERADAVYTATERALFKEN